MRRGDEINQYHHYLCLFDQFDDQMLMVEDKGREVEIKFHLPSLPIHSPSHLKVLPKNETFQ